MKQCGGGVVVGLVAMFLFLIQNKQHNKIGGFPFHSLSFPLLFHSDYPVRTKRLLSVTFDRHIVLDNLIDLNKIRGKWDSWSIKKL